MKNRLLTAMIAVTLSISLMGCTPVGAEIEATRGDGIAQDALTIKNTTLYHFNDSGICGCSPVSGDYIHFEGYCGIKANIVKNNVTVEAYNNKPDLENTGEISLFKEGYRDQEIKLLSVDYDKNKTSVTFNFLKTIKQIDMGKNPYKGVYYLQYNSPTFGVARIPIYYNGTKIQCAWEGDYKTEDDAKSWDDLIGKLDPEKCLDMWVGDKSNPITYPTSGQNGNCNHVKKWCELSKDILKKDDGTWSDELKVFALAVYISNHYAYDDYRVYQHNDTSRAKLAGDKYNEDKYFTYYNYVGTCWDFTNMMVIMCRYNGIPATSVEDAGHTLVAVYLNDEWVAIDNTMLAKYHCHTEDPSKENWSKRRNGSWKKWYGYYDGDMYDYNQSISTKDVHSSTGSGENPR